MADTVRRRAKSKLSNNVSWTPLDEVKFLERLGEWASYRTSSHDRIWWLRQYIAVNQDRKEGFAIIGVEHARHELRSMGLSG